MSLPDTKLEKFTSAVLKDAEEQRAKILHEIELYRKKEIEKAEEEVLHEAYVLIQKEIANIKNAHSKEISLAEIGWRKKLLKLRDDFTEQVFQAVSEKIASFAKTDAYVEYIKRAAADCPPEIREGNVIISVKKDDLGLKDAILGAFGTSAGFEVSDKIELGGILIYNSDKGIVVDQTLDLKLQNQKNWFESTSGLGIG